MNPSSTNRLRKLTLATVAVAAVLIAAVAIALPAPPDGTALAQSALEAPSNLTSTGRTSTTVSLSWTPSGTSGAEQHVGIRDIVGQAPGQFTWVSIDSDASSHTVVDLKKSTRYAFRIRASKDGQSVRSNYVNVTTLATDPEPTPTPEPTPAPTSEPKPPQDTLPRQDASTNANLTAITIDGAAIPDFSARRTTYRFGVTAAQVTVAATAEHSAASWEVTDPGTDADTNTAGHQVDSMPAMITRSRSP
jgi:chitinase